MTTNVLVAASFTVVILFALLVTSVFTGRALTSRPGDEVLKIEVTGLQWWWDVRYDNTIPARMVKTANEIHIPTGRLVLLKLTSHDVIHSFWAPNLAGKKDLIPGHHTTLFFQADKRGIFRGQCAEFCGHQHAHMAFNVVVESPEEFESWYTQQLQTSPAPSDATQTRGQQVFLTSRCVMCHSIAGTSASATAGPDLTHIASRLTIAAGTLPNTPEHLAMWIRDSQSIKPGNKMPRIELSDEELHALLAYLETLK
jgi:cytochrome c oxidase subunit 2